MIRSWAILSIIAQLLSSVALAEKSAFYSHDYAMRVGEYGGSETSSAQGSFEQKGSEGGLERESLVGEQTATKDDLVVDKAKPSTDLGVGVPVIWVGLIVNAQDPAHLEATLKDLLSHARRHQRTLGRVYLMGSTELSSITSYQLALALWGAELHKISRIPEEYEANNIARSPTWIVSTPKGEVLLDGVTDLERFFNDKGKFVDPTPINPSK